MLTKRFVVGLLIWVVASAAWATPITDTVVIGDKEWAQVSLFTGLSWNEINDVCPENSGVCNAGGELTANGQTWDMTGWTWATIVEVGDLFQILRNL